MLKQLTIYRSTGNGRYGDMLDALETLGNTEYPSAAAAAVACLRSSPIFRAALENLRREREIEPGQQVDGGGKKAPGRPAKPSRMRKGA
jgi:hypothetical protein